MKETKLPKNELLQRLTGYSMAAGALITLSQNTFGQVAYSGEVDMILDALETTVVEDSLDIDANGINDFRIGISFRSASYSSTSSNIHIRKALAVLLPDNSQVYNSLLLEYNTSIGGLLPAAIGEDAPVSASQLFWQQPNNVNSVVLEYLGSYSVVNPSSSYSGYSAFGNFRGGTNYLGVRFHIGSNLHYGWIRIEIPELGNPLTVKDWAYNVIPEAAIKTGFITPTFENETSYNGLTANISITFDEAITELSTSDFEITGANLSGISIISEGTEYELEITGDSEGLVEISLPAGAVESESKAVNSAETSFSLITSVGLNQFNTERIKVYPNPAQDVLSISLPVSADLTIVNTLGQTIISKDHVKDENLDISKLLPGNYTLLVQTAEGVFSKQFVKQ